MTDELTPRQAEIYAWVRDQLTTHYVSPTIREIGAHFGIRSTNAVLHHLDVFEKRGLITREPLKSRSIRLVAPCCPNCGHRLDGKGDAT